MNKVKQFQLKIVFFTAVKNRCILHGRVFVMSSDILYSMWLKSLIGPFSHLLHYFVCDNMISVTVLQENQSLVPLFSKQI